MKIKFRHTHLYIGMLLLLLTIIKTILTGEGDLMASSGIQTQYLRSGIALFCWLFFFLLSYYGLSSLQHTPWAKYIMLCWFFLAGLTFSIRAIVHVYWPELLHANLWNFLVSVYNTDRIPLLYFVLWGIDKMIGRSKDVPRDSNTSAV